MKESDSKPAANDDAYKRYLESVENEKAARLDLIENLSEEEIRRLIAASYKNFDIKKVMTDWCLRLNLKYNFDKLKGFLDQVPDIVERLKVLHTLKYDFEREIEQINGMPYTKDYLQSGIYSFNKSCQSEIEKLTTLMQLETLSKQTAGDQATPPKAREGMNSERAYLFFEYLFTFINATANKTKRHRAIELLTGYKIGQLNKLPSWFEKEKLQVEEKTEVNKKFSEDMNEVRKLFILLGLNEIAGRVDKDLGN